MKRLILITLIKMCAEAILITMIAGIGIVVIGHLNNWNTSISYSNAFFIAGGLMIVAGGMSRMIAGQSWFAFQFIYSESFRNMSSGERANFIIEASSSARFVIMGVMSGILLILISVIVAKI